MHAIQKLNSLEMRVFKKLDSHEMRAFIIPISFVLGSHVHRSVPNVASLWVLETAHNKDDFAHQLIERFAFG